ncbi:DUF655 domain-containing protein [Methanobrevibacter filiformis]|nr:DUF655 domain-containing protein [Methanobrevibacter filiformis]
MEDYAIILDYLPYGYIKEGMSTFKKKPVAQAIGTENFTLLELIPKEDVDLEIHETVYIGQGKRDKINRVKGKLDFENLTATSRIEVDYVVEEIIHDKEEKYVKFFNEAVPLNTRLHTLEFLPGVGNKHMWAIIKAREENPFESFEDMKKRVKLIGDPAILIAKKVKMELDTTKDKRGKNKYNLFTYIPRTNKRPNRDSPRKPNKGFNRGGKRKFKKKQHD